jgi:hypothetical protein
MTTPENAVTCHWLTPTRILPSPYRHEASVKPWSCVRDVHPRPLDACELRECATCPRWQPRTFEAAKRDLVFETWGVGIPVPEDRTFDEVKRDLVLEAWGVR